MALIEAQSLSVEFPIYELRGRSLRKDLLKFGIGGRITNNDDNQYIVEALKDINLTFREGDRVGLVGQNGSGKTTLLRVLSGIYEPTKGSIHIDGNVVPILDSSVGGDVDASGYENIMRRSLFFGMSRSQVHEHIDDIGEFSGLGNFLYLPMRTYSSGMAMRLAFSVATCQRPEILLMDEVIGTGDASFFSQAEMRLNDFIGNSSIVVLATHSEALLKRFCTKAILLDHGSIVIYDDVDTVLNEYRKMQNL